MAKSHPVLVFGASGLIGRGVIDSLLATGTEVASFSRSANDSRTAVTTVRGDIADREHVTDAIASIAPQTIVQLAARLQSDCDEDPAAAVETNIDGMVNVLEAARKHGARRVVFGSSVAAYGIRGGVLLEDDPPAADCSLYGETKRFGEILGAHYADLYGMEFVALRYSGIFGPGAVHGKGMALARAELKSTADGRDVSLDYVAGDELCHLTYLPDAVEATLAAIRHSSPRHRVYNVAGPQENYISLRDFHAEVVRAAPGAGKATFHGKGRSGGVMDITRLCNDLGVTPRFTVREGLSDEFSRSKAFGN